MEDKVNNRYRVYKIVVDGTTDDGATLERSLGCNGERHADWLEEIFFDKKGEVEFAKHIATVERGDCDGTCGEACGEERLGGFLYPFPKPS